MNPKDIPLPTDHEMLPIGIVRLRLRQELADGELATCPCCGGSAKVYSRPINRTMVAALRLIARSDHGLDNAQIISRTKQSGGGNISLLQHWGLVSRTNEGAVWKVTPRGIHFLSGRIAIPSRVLLYNNHFLGFDAREELTVRAFDEVEFDLSEILAAEPVREADVITKRA